MRTIARWCALAVLAACGGTPSGAGEDAAPPAADAGLPPGAFWAVALDMASEPTSAIDVLFVIDDSGSVDGLAAPALIGSGDRMFALLAEILGAPPDLHVGVVSTDLGAGPTATPGCSISGRDGLLQSAPRLPGCEAPDGRFIVDVSDGAGGRVRNYEGTIGEALACIGTLGNQGCGFEQPFEAMRRALDGTHPENAGFLREDALLAIVIVTDEDDCSTGVPELLFAPEIGPDDPLGPRTSFRCFEHGVVCDPDEPRRLGTHVGCRSREDSALVTPVAAYVDFLLALKPDPTKVYVHVEHATMPYERVQLDEQGRHEVAPTCDAAGDDPIYARGAVGWRIDDLRQAFAGRSEYTGVCQLHLVEDWPMWQIASRIGRVASGSGCLMGQLHIDPVCRAFDVSGRLTDAEARTPMPSCDDAPEARPCFVLRDDHVACETDRDYAIEATVFRDVDPPSGNHVVIECLHVSWRAD